MKTCKKLLAFLLSVMLLAGMVVLPASAADNASDDPIVSRYVSLLDLSQETVGNTWQNENYMPEGSGIVKLSAKNVYHAFDGTQEIIENEQCEKAWKIHFDVAMLDQGYLNGIKNEFAIRLEIPSKYVPYISGINADILNGAATSFRMNYGLVDSSGMATVMTAKGQASYATTGNPAEPISILYDTPITDLYKLSINSIEKEWKNLTEKWTLGSDFTYAYMTMYSRGCTGEEGGYAIINDFGITLTGTQSEIESLFNEPKTYQLLDLSDCELGMMTDYPAGMSEFFATNSSGSTFYKEYAGTKEVIEKEDGSRALKLDLTSATFKRSASEGSADSYRLFQGGYQNGSIYALKLDVPANHVPLIDTINLKLDKQTSAMVIWNFGVTDGTNYAKDGLNRNEYIAEPDVLGVTTTSYYPGDLYAMNGYSVGAYNNPNSDYEKWEGYEYSSIYVMLSASESVGYVTIDEISYTIDASMAEYDQYKGFLTDFEGLENTITEYAVSGTRAKAIDTKDGYNTQRWAFLGRNTNLADATGLSFSVINPTSSDTTYKFMLKGADGSSYVIADAYRVPANSTRKVIVDFSAVYEDRSPDNAGVWSAGDMIALSPSEIANLTTITFMCRQQDITVYADNYQLIFDTKIDPTEIDITNSTGASETL